MPATVKTQALDQLTAGTSILIPFAALAIKLPGWSSEADTSSDELQREVNGATDAALLSVSENEVEADTFLPGAVSTTKVTFDISDTAADAIHDSTSHSQSHISWGPVPDTGRYYGAVNVESQADDNIIIPDDYDDIDSLADLEPLSPQSWEFDDEGEEEGAGEHWWHSLDDPVVLPDLPEIIISAPPEDIFPALEDLEAYTSLSSMVVVDGREPMSNR